MPTTPGGLPYPASTDPANVPADLQALAVAAETALNGKVDATAVIARSLLDAKGDVIAATADNTPGRLGVGADGTFLRANSATTTGLEWAAQSADVPLSTFTTKGDLAAATGSAAVSRLGVGANGTLLRANSATTTGLEWAAVSTVKNFALLTTVASPTSSTTVSSLSGYDTLFFFFQGTGVPISTALTVRWNNDSASNYSQGGLRIQPTGANDQTTVISGTSHTIGQSGASVGSSLNGAIMLTGCSTSGVKVLHIQNSNQGTANLSFFAYGIWNNSATVSSAVFSGFNSSGTLFVYGSVN